MPNKSELISSYRMEIVAENRGNEAQLAADLKKLQGYANVICEFYALIHDIPHDGKTAEEVQEERKSRYSDEVTNLFKSALKVVAEPGSRSRGIVSCFTGKRRKEFDEKGFDSLKRGVELLKNFERETFSFKKFIEDWRVDGSEIPVGLIEKIETGAELSKSICFQKTLDYLEKSILSKESLYSAYKLFHLGHLPLKEPIHLENCSESSYAAFAIASDVITSQMELQQLHTEMIESKREEINNYLTIGDDLTIPEEISKEQKKVFEEFHEEFKNITQGDINWKFLSKWSRTKKEKLSGFSEELKDLLIDYRCLYKDYDFIDIFGKMFVSEKKLSELKPTINWTMPKFSKNRLIQYSVNHLRFKVKSVENNGRSEIYIGFHRLADTNMKSPLLWFRIKPHCKCEVWRLVERDHNGKTLTEIEMKRKADRESIFLKLQSVGCQNHSERGRLEICLTNAVNIEKYYENNKIANQLITSSLIYAKKNMKELDYGTRVTFCDLNHKPLAAVVTYELCKKKSGIFSFKYKDSKGDFYGWWNRIDEDKIGEVVDAERHAQYQSLLFSLENLSAIRSLYKRLTDDVITVSSLTGKKTRKFSQEKLESLYHFPEKALGREGILNGFTEDNYKEKLNQEEIDKLRVIIWDRSKELIDEYERLQARRMNPIGDEIFNELCAELFLFRMIMSEIISLKKSLTYSHLDPEWEITTQKGICKKLYRQYGNLTDDMSKRLASAIITKAASQGSHVLIMEDLDNFKSDASQDKKTNKSLQRWAKSGFFDCLERKAMKMGIGLAKRSADYTSQIDPFTNDWAYRDEKDKTLLWVTRQREPLDSDIAAADNLANRCFSRGENQIYLPVRFSDDCVLVVNKSAYVRSTISYETALNEGKASIYVKIENGVLTSMSKKNYEDLLKKSKRRPYGEKHFYKINGKWENYQALQIQKAFIKSIRVNDASGEVVSKNSSPLAN